MTRAPTLPDGAVAEDAVVAAWLRALAEEGALALGAAEAFAELSGPRLAELASQLEAVALRTGAPPSHRAVFAFLRAPFGVLADGVIVLALGATGVCAFVDAAGGLRAATLLVAPRPTATPPPAAPAFLPAAAAQEALGRAILRRRLRGPRRAAHGLLEDPPEVPAFLACSGESPLADVRLLLPLLEPLTP